MCYQCLKIYHQSFENHRLMVVPTKACSSTAIAPPPPTDIKLYHCKKHDFNSLALCLRSTITASM